MEENILVPIVLVPILAFLLSGMTYGYLIAGVIAGIICFMANLTKEIGIKELLFVSGLNVLILLIYFYLFILFGVNFTVKIDSLIEFAVGNLFGGALTYLIKK